jgi:GT2 family glycosyltransferase
MADPYQPSCTVVICTRNRPAELDRCLEAISRLDYQKFDTLVVDNAPSSDLARQVAARWGAQYLLEPVVGLSRARNSGAHACATELVAYLDDDCVPERDWLAALVAEFRDAAVVAVTGAVHPLGFVRNASVSDELLAGYAPSGEWKRLDRGKPFWFEMASFGGMGDGGNMALRRAVFEAWAGFDERLGRGAPIPGAEEHSAFASLIEAGYAIVYTPASIVYHPHPMSLEEMAASELRAYSVTAAYATLLLFESRHRWRVLKYLIWGQIGRDRDWRGPSKPMASRLRVFFACLPAPFLCLQSCIGHKRSRGRVHRPKRDGSTVQASPTLPL